MVTESNASPGASGDDFKQRGYRVFSREQVPFSANEWNELYRLVFGDITRFSMVTLGDTEEAASVRVHRLLRDGNLPIPDDPDLMARATEMIGDSRRLAFFQRAVDKPNLMIRRAQSHILGQDAFIGRHVDSKSSPHYLAAVIVMFSAAKEGGDFLVFGKTGEIRTFHDFGMIITDADLPHEVTKVRSGERRTLAFWLADAASPA